MACHKLAFRTVEAAQRTMAVVAAFRPGSQQPIRLYECPDCGLMHFTSQEQQDRPDDSTVVRLAPVTPIFTAQAADCMDCGAPLAGTKEPVRVGDGFMHPSCAKKAEKRARVSNDEVAAAVEVWRAERAANEAEREREAAEARAKKAASTAEYAARTAYNTKALRELPAWMKDKAREIAALIWQGKHQDAFAIADALGGLPAKPMNRADAEAWFAVRVEERREYLSQHAPACEPILPTPSPEPESAPAAPPLCKGTDR